MGQRLPPVDARPLSQILEAVEESHSGVIVSADGRSCGELRIDPRSAKTLRDSRGMNYDIRPPAGGETAAQIGRAIEEHKLGLTSAIEPFRA